jgi:DNA-directed RNA polymerase subunit RPC12/RpoP
MRTLGLICASIALLGILAFTFFSDLNPAIVIPIIIVSGIMSVIFILVGGVLGRRTAKRKIYQCVGCGLKFTGQKLKNAGNLCPMCGGSVFA